MSHLLYCFRAESAVDLSFYILFPHMSMRPSVLEYSLAMVFSVGTNINEIMKCEVDFLHNNLHSALLWFPKDFHSI